MLENINLMGKCKNH